MRQFKNYGLSRQRLVPNFRSSSGLLLRETRGGERCCNGTKRLLMGGKHSNRTSTTDICQYAIGLNLATSKALARALHQICILER